LSIGVFKGDEPSDANGDSRTVLYSCAIDGFTYESRDAVASHLRMQHQVEDYEPSLVREVTFG
jgi:hypothetical protein